jgi:hypothetical protein
LTARLKHRWSIGHNYLAGITAGDWWRLLKANGFSVDPTYWHRGAVVTLLSLLNSIARRAERKHDRAVAETEITRPPVFILGHWRSGTTHLHNLLAQDDVNFCYANTYQVVNPHTFLTTEEANTRRFAWMIPDKRPMDNMALSIQSPQEDEFAPLLMSLLSPYLGVSFPRSEAHYHRYLTFRDVPEAERTRWKDAFRWFLKKLTYKYEGRALLLKSPPHTARIRLLLEMFPDAKFIHIHRQPEEVFVSFRHYYDTAMWHTYLQVPDRGGIDDEIIHRYRDVFEAFFADKELIPQGNFHEVSFADVESDPLSVTDGIYDALGIPGKEAARGKIAAYVATLADYEKNRFTPLDEAVKERLRGAWAEYYQRWGYEIP